VKRSMPTSVDKKISRDLAIFKVREKVYQCVFDLRRRARFRFYFHSPCNTKPAQ